jgi:hypothetical protein
MLFQASVLKVIGSENFKVCLREILLSIFSPKDPAVVFSILEHYYSKNKGAGPNTLFLPLGYSLVVSYDGIYFIHEFQCRVKKINEELHSSIDNYNVYFRKKGKR